MSLKFLEILKNLQDKDILFLLNESFNFYTTKSDIHNLIKNDENNRRVFSSLIRFYRSIYSNKKLEEETFNLQLKEILKGKELSLKALNDQIALTISKQNQKIKFNNINIFSNQTLVINRTEYLNGIISNIKNLRSLSWKLNINVSNINSNRVKNQLISY